MSKTVRISLEHYDSLVRAGRLMSNWMYNQSQANNFAIYKGDMQEMVRKWDAQTSFMHSTYFNPAK